MTDPDLIARYNYDAYVAEKIQPWLNFDRSPPIGVKAPDFPLTELDGTTTRLSTTWSAHIYTIVEFGSFT